MHPHIGTHAAGHLPSTVPAVLLRLVKHSLAIARLHRVSCPEPPQPPAVLRCAQRCDESLCRLRLAAALTEIQRLRSAFGSTFAVEGPPPGRIEFNAVAEPHELSRSASPSTRRKLYAPPALGDLPLRPQPEVGGGSSVTLAAYQRVSNSGQMIDFLV